MVLRRALGKIAGNGVAFTGEGNLVQEATGFEHSITVQGTDFKLTKNGCPSVSPPLWGCADIEITFTPTATGLRTGTATVVSSASSTPLIGTLQGIGVSAGVGTLSAGSLTFGEQAVGTTGTLRG